MFTGIVGELGSVVAMAATPGGSRLIVGAGTTLAGLRPGDSVAVNGVCVTAVSVEPGRFEADVVRETLDRTTLGGLKPGSPVNLERPLAASGRLDGHFVQGHVDGVALVRSIGGDGADVRMWVDPPDRLSGYVAEKGSVALDGVSLTVSGVDLDGFEVALIPHTLAVTTLGGARSGTRLNLEVDVLAKYVERLIEGRR